MPLLETLLAKLSELERVASEADARAMLPLSVPLKLLITILFLTLLLFVPLENPVALLPCFLYPMALSCLYLYPYPRLLKYSLAVLPFLLTIAVVNPLMDRKIVFYVGDVPVSRGWAYLISIILRGMLSMQAALLLMLTTPFSQLCQGLRKLHVPKIFTTLLAMIYRYLWVLLLEAVSMDRARRARSFGRRHYPLRLWGVLVAQLLLRSLEHAERVGRAMEARGA